MHLRDRIDRRIGFDDVESLTDIGAVVIDETCDRRYVVAIDESGALYCRNCAGAECNHAKRALDALRDYGLLEGG
jgi:hypothetical protein